MCFASNGVYILPSLGDSIKKKYNIKPLNAEYTGQNDVCLTNFCVTLQTAYRRYRTHTLIK